MVLTKITQFAQYSENKIMLMKGRIVYNRIYNDKYFRKITLGGNRHTHGSIGLEGWARGIIIPDS